MPRVLRRQLISTLQEVYVDNSLYSFDEEQRGRDRPLHLDDEATVCAQRVLPIFELGSPRHYRNGILWRVSIYERNCPA